MSADIFISYRRQDAAFFAARLRDRLEQTFPGQVFLDVSAIQGGTVFPALLEQAVGAARVLIAVISPGWLNGREGGARLGDPPDFVTLELSAALRSGKTVIPVLMEGCRMPSAAELPEALKALAQHSAMSISHERFNSDVTHLIDALYQPLGIRPPSRLEKVVAAAGGQEYIRPRARDAFAVGSLVAGVLSGLLVLLWWRNSHGDPMEGLHLLFFGGLAAIMALLGKQSTKRRGIALAALALAALSLSAFMVTGSWRGMRFATDPWMHATLLATRHQRQAELPADQVIWWSRAPFESPPPTVICDCLVTAERPAPQQPYAPGTRLGLRNDCAVPVSAAVARARSPDAALFYPWSAARDREFTVIALAPKQTVRLPFDGAYGYALQPWVCEVKVPAS